MCAFVFVLFVCRLLLLSLESGSEVGFEYHPLSTFLLMLRVCNAQVIDVQTPLQSGFLSWHLHICSRLFVIFAVMVPAFGPSVGVYVCVFDATSHSCLGDSPSFRLRRFGCWFVCVFSFAFSNVRFRVFGTASLHTQAKGVQCNTVHTTTATKLAGLLFLEVKCRALCFRV